MNGVVLVRMFKTFRRSYMIVLNSYFHRMVPGSVPSMPHSRKCCMTTAKRFGKSLLNTS